MYLQYVQSARLTPQTVDLGGGAKGHWLGNTNAKKVLVWYHGMYTSRLLKFIPSFRNTDGSPNPGGGFCLPANMGYFKFFEELISSARASGYDLAVFVLSYTLTPHARYPRQLVQAAEALRYIVSRTRRSPADVLVGGDSAGGNLAVGVLSHLSHPHPAIPGLKLDEPLAGVVLISPWTSLEASPTGVSNNIGDLITTQVAGPWSSAYLGNVSRDYYTDASTAPSTWFENLLTKNILVLGGGNEIMRPMIEDFVQKVEMPRLSHSLSHPEPNGTDCKKNGFPSVELFIGDREAHVAPVFNLYVGSKTETEQGKKLKEWLKKLL